MKPKFLLLAVLLAVPIYAQNLLLQQGREALTGHRYDKLLATFPNAVWCKKAIFKKADAYIAQKPWDKAFSTLVSLPLMA